MRRSLEVDENMLNSAQLCPILLNSTQLCSVHLHCTGGGVQAFVLLNAVGASAEDHQACRDGLVKDP